MVEERTETKSEDEPQTPRVSMCLPVEDGSRRSGEVEGKCLGTQVP